jgi:hypothetical protein
MDDDGVLGNFYEERKKIKYISRILDIRMCVGQRDFFIIESSGLHRL